MMAIVAIIGCFAVLTVEGNTRDKARYYYLEGARQAAMDHQAEAYEYYKKAYKLDPSLEDAAFSYGSQRLFVRNDTLQGAVETARSLRLIQGYVDAYPKDQYAGEMYSYIASRLDTAEEAIRVLERMEQLMPAETHLLPNLADVYMMKRRHTDAVETINRYEAIEGKSKATALKKMTYLLAGGDTIGAINEATALVESNPRNPDYMILKGNLFEVVGQPDSTLTYFKEAERISPESGHVKMALASYYMERGDSVSLDRALYDALLSEDFALEEKLSILGDYLQKLIDDKGGTERGDYLFDVLTEQYPHEPLLIDLLSRYKAASGNFTEASEQIGYALGLDPTNTTYWIQKMRYELADNRTMDVINTYKEARQHIETPEVIDFMYAAAAAELDNYQDAEKVYGDLIHKMNPTLPIDTAVDASQYRNSLSYEELQRISTYYNMLGDMYYRAEQLDKAFVAYDNSLYFFPDNILTLNNYAYFLSENGGDLDKALAMSRKALDGDDSNPTYLDTYAWILFKKKEYKEALEYMQLAFDFAETDDNVGAEYYSHMGDILFMNQQQEEAVKYWEKALEMEPNNELLRKKVEHKTFFFE